MPREFVGTQDTLHRQKIGMQMQTWQVVPIQRASGQFNIINMAFCYDQILAEFHGFYSKCQDKETKSSAKTEHHPKSSNSGCQVHTHLGYITVLLIFRAKATAKVEKHFLADHSDDEMLAEPNPKKKVSTSRKKSRPVDSNNNNESSRSSTPSTLKNPGWLTE
jgi:hypothetical protein